MRIAAWNIAHQVKSRAIPPTLLTGVAALQPDVIVLTEFVPAEAKGRSRQPFYEALKDRGMKYLLPEYSSDVTRNGTRNHTLVASRRKMVPGDLTAATTPLPGPTGFLHVRFPDDGFEVAGLRIPSYKQTEVMREYWGWLTGMLAAEKGRPMIMIGDLNVNPAAPRPKWKAKLLTQIQEDWDIPSPRHSEGLGSYVSKTGKWTSIDHAVVSKHFTNVKASYVSESHGHTFASQGGDMSDHAVLVLDFDPHNSTTAS